MYFITNNGKISGYRAYTLIAPYIIGSNAIDFTTQTLTATSGIEVSHATANTLTGSGGHLAVEGNTIWDSSNAPQGATVIESGNMPAAATLTISSIPATYAYLLLEIKSWSQGTNTAALYVRCGNGSADATAGNYLGVNIINTTVSNFTTNARASMADSGTQTTAQTGNAFVYIFGYQSTQAAKHFQTRSASPAGTEALSYGYFKSSAAIDIIEVGTTAAGSFDGGTYVLWGCR